VLLVGKKPDDGTLVPKPIVLCFYTFNLYLIKELLVVRRDPTHSYKTVLLDIPAALKGVQKPPDTLPLSQDQQLRQVTADTTVHSVRNLDAAALLIKTGNQIV
jgi:hypothetical protein